MKQDVAGRLSQFEIARQGNANGRREATTVQGVTLDHHDRTPKARPRTNWRREISPADVTLTHYHSESLSVRLAAADRNPSGLVSTSSEIRFMASVIASES
jgi:hypothetical protein